jgi:hypothetical protein
MIFITLYVVELWMNVVIFVPHENLLYRKTSLALYSFLKIAPLENVKCPSTLSHGVCILSAPVVQIPFEDSREFLNIFSEFFGQFPSKLNTQGLTSLSVGKASSDYGN